MNQELTDIVVRFETRVRQLLMQQEKLQQQQEELRRQITEREDEILNLQIQNEELKQQYNRLKMAKYIDVADNEVKDLKGRIRAMVRDIDRCISMLKVV